MDHPATKHPSSSSALFEVYLRLRPSVVPGAERFLDVEDADGCEHPTHITIKPPASDHRKKAIERFAFTRVFEEDKGQSDVFGGTGMLKLIDGVFGAEGREGRDGLFATLGVTGSGKSHTILGSKTQRGLTQMALDVLFQSTQGLLVDQYHSSTAFPSIAAADASEAHLFPASLYLDTLYGDGASATSRSQTPMGVGSQSPIPTTSKQRYIPRPSMMPQTPNVDDLALDVDRTAEYAIVISMYEVYNDRIFDLLTGAAMTNKSNNNRRRALLFKSTEQSPDRKVVAGLKKIICSTLEEALMVLETGLNERKVAGTGSNAVSSRSHGFFCVEVKKRDRETRGPWSGSTLTVVDLAGSERARNAKTAGETLAEAGKINESLMYLGQCMQMQSDSQEGNKRNIVPFRQCKLTELLFSNSFPSSTAHHHNSSHHHHHHRRPQKAIMVVTAEPTGDYNATSQILRYSALAREVTVPRIPSVTEQIQTGKAHLSRPGTAASSNGRHSPNASMEELEAAMQHIARLQESMDVLQLQLREETARRQAAEASWRASEENMLSMEQQVRDELSEEFEDRILRLQRQYKDSWDEEADRKDEHVDRKIEILEQGIRIYEDADVVVDEGTEGRVRELEEENKSLRVKVERLEREGAGRSPVKKQRVLKARKWEVPDVSFDG
ncbi:kinesin family protein-like protein [Saccharata proteae CBS 121410]|uniref:Kinesin-like protein n=1 Tax=Saccharata proteae CBS 121410 TaxID=1314787 RepID=A0A9P4HR03_9PEZI|nr:kinesin family protein-like protein [Saccharata proteae CBS 121410]